MSCSNPAMYAWPFSKYSSRFARNCESIAAMKLCCQKAFISASGRALLAKSTIELVTARFRMRSAPSSTAPCSMLITRLRRPNIGELHIRSTCALSVGSALISLPAFCTSGDAPRTLVSSSAVCGNGGKPLRTILFSRCLGSSFSDLKLDCAGG